MDMQGKVAVVTGGGSGIGAACAAAFAAAGARAVVVADIDADAAHEVASGIGGIGVACDVRDEAQIRALVARAEAEAGPVDLFMANAGILGRPGGFELEDGLWDAMWQIHTMAHVWAARAVVPGMLARGHGAFITTASAAGLLTLLESAPYAVTKHAAVAFAEWLRIQYGRRGLVVSCLCPQSVDTAMVRNAGGHGGSAALDGIRTAEEVAQCVLDALADERFLILPHPEVEAYFRNKGSDYPRWLGAMQKGALRFGPGAPT